MRQFLFALGACAVLCSPALSQMAGPYTVNATIPTGGINFATINEAITALQTQGVNGPVNLQLFDDGGPWTEANTVTTIINPGTAVISIMGNLIAGVSAANRVTIEAFPGESPVLDATGQNFGVQMVTCQYFTIKGLEILGATVDGISVYADGASGAAGALLGNEVIGNKIHDIAGCGINIYANLGTGAWFDGTIVRNNFLWTCQVTNGGTNNQWRLGYLNERRSINAVIENNSFYADTGVGTQFGVIATYYSPGVGGPAASVRNNLLLKTIANGPLYRHVDAGSIAQVMDNNVYEDPSGGSFMAGASGTSATLMAFQSANPTLEQSSIMGAAGFTNTAGGDLHITTTSSAVDAGATIAGLIDDIDGDPRPLGSAYDAGADELLAGPPEYQVNSAEAMLTVNGVTGTLATPAVVTIGVNAPATLTLGSSSIGFLWDLGLGVAPLISLSGGAFATFDNQVLNLDLTDPTFTTLWNYFQGPGFVPVTIPFSVPNAVSLSTQMIIVSPTTPSGIALSQPTRLIVQ